MKSLFEESTYNEIRDRLSKLTESNERKWGKMSHGQMLHHCQLPLQIVLNKNDFGLKPNWFAKTFFKKAMYSDKAWRKNLPTMPQFKESEFRDFAQEKEKLEKLLAEFALQKDSEIMREHPTFGKLTKEQWGKMQYKHLDHHFRQFGV